MFAKLDGEFIRVDAILSISEIKPMGDTYQYHITYRNGHQRIKSIEAWTKMVKTKVKKLFRTVEIEDKVTDYERIEQDLIKMVNSRDVFINQIINPGANTRQPENAPVSIVG